MEMLRTIRLEMARTPDHPNGSTRHGYELRAPLTHDGHIDLDAFKNVHQDCTVRRFWAGEADRSGHLKRNRNHSWVFDYGPGDADDETFYHLETHAFVIGNYVTIKEPDGHSAPFRIVSIR